MSEILSQSEIEALLTSLSSDEAEPRPAGPEPGIAATGLTGPAAKQNRSTVAYELYDFRRPDKFSKEQLRTLQMLHETFARLAGSQLSAYLRAPVSIDLISLEQVPYDEYLRSINSSVFTITSLPPLTGQAVLEIEFQLVFTMLDRLLGGPGRAVNRSVLTDIERPLVKQIIERMFMGLKSAWEGVVIVNPGIDGMETSSQFVQIAPPTDIVVTILFEIRIGGARGAMSLCVPYLVLKPIASKLSAQKWFTSAARRANAASRRALGLQIQQTSVELAAKLGNVRMSIGDFLHIGKGDLLRLDQRTDQDLILCVNNSAKFEGRPALDGKKIVFKVTRPYEP